MHTSFSLECDLWCHSSVVALEFWLRLVSFVSCQWSKSIAPLLFSGMGMERQKSGLKRWSFNGLAWQTLAVSLLGRVWQHRVSIIWAFTNKSINPSGPSRRTLHWEWTVSLWASIVVQHLFFFKKHIVFFFYRQLIFILFWTQAAILCGLVARCTGDVIHDLCSIPVLMFLE